MADLLRFPIERTRRPARALLAPSSPAYAAPMRQADHNRLLAGKNLPRPCWADKVHLPNGVEGWND